MKNLKHYIDAAKEHRWTLKSDNGEILCASSEGFSSHQNSENNTMLTLLGLQEALDPDDGLIHISVVQVSASTEDTMASYRFFMRLTPFAFGIAPLDHLVVESEDGEQFLTWIRVDINDSNVGDTEGEEDEDGEEGSE